MSKVVLGEASAHVPVHGQGARTPESLHWSVGNGHGQSLWPPLVGLDGPAALGKGCFEASVCESWGALWEKPTQAGLSPAKEEGLRTSFPLRSFWLLARRAASPAEAPTHSP